MRVIVNKRDKYRSDGCWPGMNLQLYQRLTKWGALVHHWTSPLYLAGCVKSPGAGTVIRYKANWCAESLQAYVPYTFEITEFLGGFVVLWGGGGLVCVTVGGWGGGGRVGVFCFWCWVSLLVFFGLWVCLSGGGWGCGCGCVFREGVGVGVLGGVFTPPKPRPAPPHQNRPNPPQPHNQTQTTSPSNTQTNQKPPTPPTDQTHTPHPTPKITEFLCLKTGACIAL